MAKSRSTKSAKDNGTNKATKKDFDEGVLSANPPVEPKKLPRRVYKRGNQGTFAYSPDIAIYIYTSNHGIIDLGPYMTSWTVQRNVNSVSMFQCTFDNKFSRYDRVIRRMDRIAVFVKRIEWLQIFAGYITIAPWETVIPGDSTIEAECTLKRLYHTYWDPASQDSWDMFPIYIGEGAWKATDGGAAESVFRILTQMVHWDSSQIKIQKLPEQWIEQAAKLIQKVQAEEYDDHGEQLDILKDILHDIINSYGWVDEDGGSSDSKKTYGNEAAPSPDGKLPADSEAQWKRKKKQGELKKESDVVSIRDEASQDGPASLRGDKLYLRADAAASLNKIKNAGAGGSLKGNIAVAYLSTNQSKNLSESGSKKFVTSDRAEGWGTVIYLVGAGSNWAKKNTEIFEKYGWKQEGSDTNRWIFVGTGEPPNTGPGAMGYNIKDWPASKDNAVDSSNSTKDDVSDLRNSNPNSTFGLLNNPAMPGQPFSSFGMFPGQSMESNMMIGSRAWVNDVPVIDTIGMMCSVANRDFMSAPNGDFIAFYPDRIGANGKEPVVLIRDIEVIGMDLSIRDDTLVTHYISVGDLLGASYGFDADVLFGGMITVEMTDLMEYLLGLEKDESFQAIGEWMLGRFGIRPLREDFPNLRNSGWNYALAIHNFQRFWAGQWIAPLEVTFLPEIYPGMRIELADHNMAFYVEGVSHSGSRMGGWTTNIQTSVPTHRVNGKWKMLRAEWPAGLEDVPETADTPVWVRPFGYSTSLSSNTNTTTEDNPTITAE